MTDRPSLFGFALCASGATIIALGLASRALGNPPDVGLEWILGIGLFVLLAIPGRHWGRAFAAEREREAIDLAEKATRARLLALQVEEKEKAASVPPAEAPAPDNQVGWDAALTIFFEAGQDAGGFSSHKLRNVIGSETWKVWQKFYVSRGILVDRGSNVGTVWAPNWRIERVRALILAGHLPRPTPGEPPILSPYTGRTAQHSAPRQSVAQGTAERAVVDG